MADDCDHSDDGERLAALEQRVKHLEGAAHERRKGRGAFLSVVVGCALAVLGAAAAFIEQRAVMRTRLEAVERQIERLTFPGGPP